MWETECQQGSGNKGGEERLREKPGQALLAFKAAGTAGEEIQNGDGQFPCRRTVVV